jgi:hypothetical protein
VKSYVIERDGEPKIARPPLAAQERLIPPWQRYGPEGGFLPICANCKSIRDDEGRWTVLEDYLLSRTGTELTHTVCAPYASVLY